MRVPACSDFTCIPLIPYLLRPLRPRRLIRQAVEAAKPVLMVSLGPSRADALPGVEKIEMKAGPVLRGVLEKRIGWVRFSGRWGAV